MINRNEHSTIVHSRSLARQFLLLAALALSLCTANAQTLNKAKLDQFFDRLAEKNKAMGSLQITKAGKTLYTRSIGFGNVNGTEKKPLAAATEYRIGSITKMFTAAMIFQLIEEKKLRLNDHLDKFFPQIPNAAKITIEHILGHRSGIDEATENPAFRSLRLKGLTKEEMIGFISKSTPDFEPGTKYAYSSSGYFVLGMIVEKLTGRSYDEILEKKINARLGMHETYVATPGFNEIKNEAASYRFVRDWEQQPSTHPGILFGSGSLVSTTNDLSLFINGLFNGKLVSKTNLDLMMKKNLGMDTFMYNGKRAYGHTGGIDGFGSWLAYTPGEQLCVAYATNGKVYPVSNIIEGVFSIYHNEPFDVPSFEGINISTAMLDSYAGVYSAPDFPVKVTITRDKQTLFFQPNGQSAVPLEATAIDQFKIEAAGIVIKFDAAKKQLSMIKRNGPERILTKEN